MRHKLGLFTAILCTYISVAWAAEAPEISPVPELPAITRGQKVTVHGKNFPAQEIKASLRTGKADDPGLPLPATRDSDTAVSFLLPKDMKTGKYLVYILIGPAESEVPGHLQVLEDEAAKVQLGAIYPVTNYRSEEHDGFDFDIVGQNLARSVENNIVEVDKVPQPVGNKEECDSYINNRHYKKICLEYDNGMETRRLKVKGFHPAKYKGSQQIRVQVGNNTSNALSATFSGITEQGARATAIFLFAFLALAVMGLVWKGIGQYRTAGENYSPLISFLLDKETDSFSLSKFQLLAWTAVAIFGYVYLFLCRMLIQWDFNFPPIPDGLPTLLGISVGTTVAAVGVTVTHGSKGAGPVQPSIADFVCSGGLVASDRFQLFVWTLVGVLGFLGLLLKSDPATLTELPKIPDSFLSLMGISSAGYLGGKLVRKPGPVIKGISIPRNSGVADAPLPANYPFPQPTGVTPTGKVLTINLKGENLDAKARIKINNDLLGGYQFWITGTPDPQSGFCTDLNVSLNGAAVYLEGEHTLTLINSDGQAADVKFPVDPMTIDAVENTANSTAPVDVNVKGKNFGEQMSAEWRNPAEAIAPIPIPPAAITKVSATEVIVRLVPGQQGTGKLTLISGIGLRASKTVIVT